MSDLIDLDEMEGAVVAFTANGRRYAFTKASLIDALKLRSKPSQINQASLGKTLSWLLKAIDDGNVTDTADVRQRLKEALGAFDGKVSGYPTRIPSLLAQIIEHPLGKPNASLVADFLHRYPALVESSTESMLDKVQELMMREVENEMRAGKAGNATAEKKKRRSKRG